MIYFEKFGGQQTSSLKDNVEANLIFHYSIITGDFKYFVCFETTIVVNQEFLFKLCSKV